MKESCKSGHFLRGENLYIRPDGRPWCRECLRSYQHEWYIKNREKTLARTRQRYAPARRVRMAAGATGAERRVRRLLPCRNFFEEWLK